jgi:hypothetical protein
MTGWTLEPHKSVIAMAVSAVLLGCGAAADQAGTTKAAPRPAEQLAQLEMDRPVDSTTPEVELFQERLNQMTRKCGLSETEIADMTVRARKLLADDGVKQTLYDVITGVNRGADARDGGEPCIETFERYVAMQRRLAP